MFAFLFSSVDFLQKCVTEAPRILGLSFVLFFLLCAVGISTWEAPDHSSVAFSSVPLPDCVLRSSSVIPASVGKSNVGRRVFVNDTCGEEARAWSQRVALAQQTATEKSLLLPNDLLNTEIVSMTAGYPIELMAPSIAKYDREVAALIVGIAKKESNWGKRVPRSDDGADCFNYWGFKGAGSRGVAMGHGCFGTPEEAVEKVGNRIAELVRLRSTSEPKNFTIWKCGSSCATHTPESVRKWVSDVDQYYRVLASR